MPFKLPDWFKEQQKEWYELQHVTCAGERIHPSEFNDRQVTKEKLKDMKMNSYGQEEMFSKYTDDVLIDKANYYISQCGRPRYPCATYDEALIHLVLPELIKRFQKGDNQYDDHKKYIRR